MQKLEGIWRLGGRARIRALLISMCLLLPVLGNGAAEAETPLATVNVSSLAPTGTTVDLPPIPGSSPAQYYEHYRFEATGTYIYDSVSPANVADAECTRYGSPAGAIDPTWQKDRWGAKTQDPLDDLYDLYVDGKPVDWKSVGGEPDCATEDNTYAITAPSSQFAIDPGTGRKKVSFRVYDENYANNVDLDGGLSVRIFPGGEPPQGPDDKFIETVTIDSRQRTGASSVSGLVAGEQYKFVARGTYSYSFTNEGWHADAECSITGRTDPNVAYDPVWRTHRTFIAGDTTDYLDLLVNGTERTWTPLMETTPGCNERDHTYKFTMKAATSERVNFAVQSRNHQFNVGFLYVDIYLQRGSSTPAPNPAAIAAGGIGRSDREPSTQTPLLSVNVSAGSRIPKEITLPGSTQPNGSIKYFANYRLEVSGRYLWDFNDAGNLADAECSKFARGRVDQVSVPVPDPTWQQNRFGAVKFAERRQQSDIEQDPLDLYVNGKDVEWVPLVSDGKGCNSTNSTYDYILPITSSRKVQFQVYEPFTDHARVADTQNVADADPSNNFSFTVKVYPAPEARSDPNQHVFVESVQVEVNKPQGTSTLGALVAGQNYRFVVSELFTYDYRASGKSLADAECSITPTDPVWQPQRTYPNVPASEDLYGLHVDRMDVDWVPLFDTGVGCNSTPDHSYRLQYQAPRNAPVNFAIKSLDHSFAAGTLRVDVFLVRPGVSGEGEGSGVPVDEEAKKQFFSDKEPSKDTPIEIIKVQSSSLSGANSLKNYFKGQNYRVEVSGVYIWDFRYTLGNKADAECTQFAINGRQVANDGRLDFTVNDASWQSKRFPAALNGSNMASDAFDLYVDDGQVEWSPLTSDSSSPTCNVKNHTYEYTFTPLVDKMASVNPLNFRINDPIYRHQFATGELTVKIFPGGAARSGPDDTLVESLKVDVSNPQGTRTLNQLLEGETYRVVAEGVFNYDYRRAGAKGDAECTITDSYPSTDVVYKARRNWDGVPPEDDLFDLMINDRQLDWAPLFDSGGGCNSRDHVYAYTIKPTSTGSILFKLRHTLYEVAAGSIDVDIYLVKSGTGSGVGGGGSPIAPVSSQILPAPEPTGSVPLAVTTVSVRPGASTDLVLPGYSTPLGTRYHNYYRFEVSGVYTYNNDIPGNRADVECSTATARPPGSSSTYSDPTWQPKRYPLGAFPVGTSNPSQADAANDALDLYVDNKPVDWIPTTPDPASPMCNAKDHVYQLAYRNPSGPTGSRTVKFSAFDPFYGGAKSTDGSITYTFTVKVFPGAEPVASENDVLIQVLTVDPSSTDPARTPPLLQGRRYRFVVDGVYAWDKRSAGNVADAECSALSSDGAYRARRSWGSGSSVVGEGVELLDLLLNESEVTWTPLYDPSGSGCNIRDHTYRYNYVPAQNQVALLRFNHPYPPVASGSVTVRIYMTR